MENTTTPPAHANIHHGLCPLCGQYGSDCTGTAAPAHTRGRWHSDWLGDDRGWILDERSNYIAEIVTDDECGFVVSKNEQRANACLIAAAPALLEACKVALADYCVPEGNGKIPTLLRKAIAQAEGR